MNPRYLHTILFINMSNFDKIKMVWPSYVSTYLTLSWVIIFEPAKVTFDGVLKYSLPYFLGKSLFSRNKSFQIAHPNKYPGTETNRLVRNCEIKIGWAEPDRKWKKLRSIRTVIVMLVTSLCWRLYNGDWFQMLIAESLCWRLSQCIKSVTNILNRSPTFQTCHQHIWSPTSVTNINVTYDPNFIQIWPQYFTHISKNKLWNKKDQYKSTGA